MSSSWVIGVKHFDGGMCCGKWVPRETLVHSSLYKQFKLW